MKRSGGSIYIITLISSVFLVSMGLGLSFLMLQYRRTTGQDAAVDRAAVCAELGIRHALHFTYVEPGWRDLLDNGTWLEDVAVDEASYSVSGVDLGDGDLADDVEDPVVLTCAATVGGAERTLRVQAQQPPLRLLRYAVAAGDNVVISNHVRINGDLCSNGKITKTGSDTWVFGDAEAVGTINSTDNITGNIVPGADPKTMPAGSEILQYYVARATEIAFHSEIKGATILPQWTPFMVSNWPDGLYFIQCDGRKITIKDCTIHGTLVLLNPGGGSMIKETMNWQPARADYPALLVDGNMEIQVDSSSQIQGTVFTTGGLVLDGDTAIDGAVITMGTVQLKDNVEVTADNAWADHPTKRFLEYYLAPVTGTWREVYPN